MKKIITWRKATKEEIEKGLDDSINKRMIIHSIEEVEEEEEIQENQNESVDVLITEK